MTMEVEPGGSSSTNSTEIFDFLSNNDQICFKSQQRGEDDLTKDQKMEIALEIYNKSKLTFLVRFGKYLEKNQLEFFEQFTATNCNESAEINIILKEYNASLSKNNEINSIKNRRYEALKQLIKEDSYFSEIEMMKRNPLLYEQLVGQYLTEEEKVARDKINIDEEVTLVKVLMEGIERDDAKLKRQEQEIDENMESESDEEKPHTYSQWGEFSDAPKVRKFIRKKSEKITPQEQELLKEEFISLMYESFLAGNDEDFDYNNVDNNDKFDNRQMLDNDAEDEYFDAEVPEIVENCEEIGESEDELDIYMSALNQNPAVYQLSQDMQKL